MRMVGTAGKAPAHFPAREPPSQQRARVPAGALDASPPIPEDPVAPSRGQADGKSAATGEAVTPPRGVGDVPGRVDVDELLKVLESRERAVANAEAVIRPEIERLHSLKESVAGLEAHRKQLKGEIREWRRWVEEQELYLQQLEEDIQARADAVTQREEDLKAAGNDLNRREKACVRLETQLAPRDAALKRREAVVAKREAACAAVEEVHEERKRKVRALQREVRHVAAERDEFQRENTRLDRSVSRLKGTIESLTADIESRGCFAVTDPAVRDWLIDDFEPDQLGDSEECVTLGSGPWPWNEFDGILRDKGYSLYTHGEDIDMMVLGREGWSEEEIEAQIAARAGSEIRIYSQEMFVAAMATGRDPFETADEATLRAFGRGHPALEYLMQADLRWPSTESPEDEELEFDAEGMSEESPLHFMGYVVGITKGLPAADRHRILEKAFTGALPWVGSEEYMRQWGASSSRRRLWRTANHIAWLVRIHWWNPTMGYAVDHWESDLDWLRKTLYRKVRNFTWPSTRA